MAYPERYAAQNSHGQQLISTVVYQNHTTGRRNLFQWEADYVHSSNTDLAFLCPSETSLSSEFKSILLTRSCLFFISKFGKIQLVSQFYFEINVTYFINRFLFEVFGKMYCKEEGIAKCETKNS